MPKGICFETGHAHNWIPRSLAKCAICRIEFLPSTSKDGRTKTCGNPECLRKLFSIQRTGSGNSNYTSALEKQCPICGSTFSEKPGHFKDRVCCSRKCAATWNSRTKSGSNSHAWKPKTKIHCANCGKELFKLESKLKRTLHTFCSMSCKNE